MHRLTYIIRNGDSAALDELTELLPTYLLPKQDACYERSTPTEINGRGRRNPEEIRVVNIVRICVAADTPCMLGRRV